MAIVLGVVRVWGILPERRPWLRWAVAAVVLAQPFWQLVVVPARDGLELPAEARWGQRGSVPAAEFVRGHTRRGDRILVAGAAPEIYWLSERRSITPYFDIFALVPDRIGKEASRRASFAARPPAAVVGLENAEVIDAAFPPLLRLAPYRLAFERDGARVWLRADGAAARTRPAAAP